MQIYINNQLAAVKKGISFDYVSENRLFTGSDDYSLAITLPLKDCPQNIRIFGNINRADVSVNKIVFDCEIRDRSFIKTGSVVITEISDIEVKCQFLEGRSEVNFDSTFADVYINELNLGGEETYTNPSVITPMEAMDPATSNIGYVALPWVNNNSDSGLDHNFMVYDRLNKRYLWAEGVGDLSWQPYLNYITKGICREMGYDIDLGVLEEDIRYKYLLVCNTLPPSWEIREFSRALPHWTVEEYFQKLELFYGGEFNIDHRNKKITFTLSKEILENIAPVAIHNVVDELNSVIDYEESECDYLYANNLAYAADDSIAWKYYSCDWFVNDRKKNAVVYETLAELLKENEWLKKWKQSSSLRGSNLSKMLYAKDVNMYFIIRTVYEERAEYSDGKPTGDTYYQCVLQPINFLCPRIVSKNDTENCNEIEFVPVALDYTENNWGKCIFLNCGSFSESENHYHDIASEGMTGTQKSLLAGSGESGAEYYNRIYIGWWAGTTIGDGQLPHPVIDNIEILDDWSSYINWKSMSMRLNDDSYSQKVYHKIDTRRKVSFKFLFDGMPDVRSVFIIRGKKYLCEKITGTFTERGMSRLLKGDFYEIIED